MLKPYVVYVESVIGNGIVDLREVEAYSYENAVDNADPDNHLRTLGCKLHPFEIEVHKDTAISPRSPTARKQQGKTSWNKT